MTTTRGVFPRKDADFNDYVNIAVPYLGTNSVRLAISAGNMTILNGFYSVGTPNWQDTYPASQDSAQRTATITLNKKDLRKSLTTTLRSIYNDIPDSALTNTDRTTLNLPARDTTPTRVPVPDTVPSVELDPARGSRVKIFVTQAPDEDGVSRRGKPDDVVRFEVVYNVGTTVVTTPKDCINNVSSSRSPLVLTFETEEAGLKLTVFARWVNNRSEPGPWSAVQSVMIPG